MRAPICVCWFVPPIITYVCHSVLAFSISSLTILQELFGLKKPNPDWILRKPLLSSYIETNSVIVDNDEYTEMMVHIQRIVNDACAYVLDYINHIKGTKVLHEREFSRRYQYSTLPYFHDILSID